MLSSGNLSRVVSYTLSGRRLLMRTFADTVDPSWKDYDGANLVYLPSASLYDCPVGIKMLILSRTHVQIETDVHMLLAPRNIDWFTPRIIAGNPEPGHMNVQRRLSGVVGRILLKASKRSCRARQCASKQIIKSTLPTPDAGEMVRAGGVDNDISLCSLLLDDCVVVESTLDNREIRVDGFQPGFFLDRGRANKGDNMILGQVSCQIYQQLRTEVASGPEEEDSRSRHGCSFKIHGGAYFRLCFYSYPGRSKDVLDSTFVRRSARSIACKDGNAYRKGLNVRVSEFLFLF